MKILKTFRYFLKPSRLQRELFAQFAGSTRWLYNRALEKKKRVYEAEKKTVTCYDLNNDLPFLKKQEATQWLAGIHSQVLQQAHKDVDNAFQHFFRRVKNGGIPGYPKFKRKGEGDSFRYPQGVKVEGKKAYLPKIGWVCFKKSREIEGEIKETTIIEEAGRWYICFACEIEQAERSLSLDEEKVVGIDLGLESFATIVMGKDNDVQSISNPCFLKKSLLKVRFLHKDISRKKLGSRNREKAKRRLQKRQAKLRNCRKDHAHKLSTSLVKSHDIIGVEGLSVSSLLQAAPKALARSISDAGWRQFLTYIAYKAEYAGKLLVEASRWFASSQICSSCHKKHQLELSDRVLECSCGLTIHRDVNAAINLKNFALEYYKAAGTTVSKLVELPC